MVEENGNISPRVASILLALVSPVEIRHYSQTHTARPTKTNFIQYLIAWLKSAQLKAQVQHLVGSFLDLPLSRFFAEK